MINASNHKHKEKKTNKQTKQTTIHAKKKRLHDVSITKKEWIGKDKRKEEGKVCKAWHVAQSSGQVRARQVIINLSSDVFWKQVFFQIIFKCDELV